MEIKGKIIQLLDEVSGESKTGSQWRKREYILETMDQYPKKICFNAWGEKIDQFNLQQDETINLHFDVESREYNGRWYTECKAWRVDRNIEGATAAQPAQQTYSNAPASAPSPAPAVGAEMDDDLPF